MEFIKIYFHNLGLYDYIGFGIVGVVFLLFFILSFILLFKKPTIGVLLLLFTFALPPLGVYGVHTLLQKTIRKSKLTIKKIKPLHFTNALLVIGKIDNLSKREFKKCYIEFIITRKSKSRFKSFLYRLKPIATRTIYIHRSIKAKSSYNFKKILDDTIYRKNDKLFGKIACY